MNPSFELSTDDDIESVRSTPSVKPRHAEVGDDEDTKAPPVPGNRFRRTKVNMDLECHPDKITDSDKAFMTRSDAMTKKPPLPPKHVSYHDLIHLRCEVGEIVERNELTVHTSTAASLRNTQTTMSSQGSVSGCTNVGSKRTTGRFHNFGNDDDSDAGSAFSTSTCSTPGAIRVPGIHANVRPRQSAQPEQAVNKNTLEPSDEDEKKSEPSSGADDFVSANSIDAGGGSFAEVEASIQNRTESEVQPSLSPSSAVPEFFFSLKDIQILEAQLVQEEEASLDEELALCTVPVEPVRATKDTFSAHLAHHRPTQIAVAVIVLLLGALSIALAVALSNDHGNGTDQESPSPAVYIQVGSSLDGTPNSRFGESVAMCRTGDRLAVTAPGAGVAAFVRVFTWAETNNSSASDWLPLGDDIRIDAGDADAALAVSSSSVVRSAVNVDFSGDCQVLAIGTPFHNQTGSVNLLVYNPDVKQWASLLETKGLLTGKHVGGLFGASVALSADGLRVAIGEPGFDTGWKDAGRVQVLDFSQQGNGGHLVGSMLVGQKKEQNAGSSVALSSNGTVLAYGMSTKQGDDGASARVFELVGSNLTQNWIERDTGSTTRRSVKSYDTAWFVRLSYDGNVLVNSNYYLNADGLENVEANDSLYFEAFQYLADGNTWIQLGGNIHQNATGSKSGYVIALSNDGYRVGMGDPGTRMNGGGAVSGHAHVYQYQPSTSKTIAADTDSNSDKIDLTSGGDGSGNWCQIGPNHYGENGGDQFGYSIGLSGDGRRIVMGAPLSRYNGPTHGRVQVFDIDDALQGGNMGPPCSIKSTTEFHPNSIQ